MESLLTDDLISKVNDELTKDLLKKVKEQFDQQNSVLQKMEETLEQAVQALNEQRAVGTDLQTVISSLLRTIQDGRPLTPEQIKESHWALSSERMNNLFNMAVKNGLLQRTDLVTDRSLLLVQEFNSSGVEMERAARVEMTSLPPEFKELLMNKKLGDRVPYFKEGQLAATYVIQDIFEQTNKTEMKQEFDNN